MECHKTPANGNRSLRAFTLVELLVVIAIIIVLASIATVGVSKASLKARQTQALTQFRELGIGIQGFIGDYSRPPLPPEDRASGTDVVYGVGGSGESNRYLMAALIPNDTARFTGMEEQIKDVNPRLETYYTAPLVQNNKGGMGLDGRLYDPWGSEILVAVNAPPFVDDSPGGNQGVRDRYLYTNNLAVYRDYQPRDQDYVMWSYGADLRKGKGGSASSIVPLTGTDDVVSFK